VEVKECFNIYQILSSEQKESAETSNGLNMLRTVEVKECFNIYQILGSEQKESAETSNGLNIDRVIW
jgi:hypothetical protein